jgi:hypothetical protein
VKKIKKATESFFDLIEQAKEMLLDREEIERDLIYEVAKLDSEEKSAIILAYNILKSESE